MNVIKIIGILFSFGFFCSCLNEIKPSQDKYTPRDYQLKLSAFKRRDDIIQKFEDTIPNRKYEFYYLIYLDAFNNGNSILLIKKGNRYYLTEKIHYSEKGKLKKTRRSTEFGKYEWDALEELIEEFDFWTEKQFKHRRVFDGCSYFLEVNKLSDQGKRHRIVGRLSPRHDKIGAMCEYMIRFSELIFINNQQKF